MKKIVWFLLLLIPINTFALNYSEYSDYMESDSFIEESDLCEVEEIKKYRYYHLEKEYDLIRYPSNYLNTDYPYQEEDFIYSDTIQSDVLPESEIEVLEQTDTTYYQEYKKVKYIILDKIEYQKSLSIKEMMVKDKNNNKIPYHLLTDSPLKDVVQDGNTATGYSVSKDDQFLFELEKEMNPKDLTIEFYLSGTYTKTYSFDIRLNSSSNLEEDYYHGTFSGSLSSLNHFKKNVGTFSYQDILEDEMKSVSGFVEEIDNAKIVKQETIYSYQEKLYQFYRYNKIYQDGYYEALDGYEKDMDSEKKVYRYRCREILEETEVPEEIPEIPDEEPEIPKEEPEVSEEIPEIPEEIPEEELNPDIPEKVPETSIEEQPTEIIVEVIKEVPIEVPIEIIKEVPIEIIKEIPVEVEVVKEVPVEIIKEVSTKKENSTEISNLFVHYCCYFILFVLLRKKL